MITLFVVASSNQKMGRIRYHPIAVARQRRNTARLHTHQNLIKSHSVSLSFGLERVQRVLLPFSTPSPILTNYRPRHKMTVLNFILCVPIFFLLACSHSTQFEFHSHCYLFAHYLAYHLVHCLCDGYLCSLNYL